MIKLTKKPRRTNLSDNKIGNVLSLFDGMSCGQIALNKLGIEYEGYYASEVDEYAIKVSKANFPDMIHLGMSPR